MRNGFKRGVFEAFTRCILENLLGWYRYHVAGSARTVSTTEASPVQKVIGSKPKPAAKWVFLKKLFPSHTRWPGKTLTGLHGC